MLENLWLIKERAMATISGPTIDASKAGGMRINSMVSALISVLNHPLWPSSESGRWVSA